MPTRLQIAKPDIVKHFTDAGRRIYQKRDLAQLLDRERGFWRLAQRTTAHEFIEFLLKSTALERVTLESVHYERNVVRYVWEAASVYELALSIKDNAYLSHASAVFLHGLTDLIPKSIYLNIEQSPKPPPRGAPTQETVDRAFKREQRISHMQYAAPDEYTICVLNGKHTGNLEVVTIENHREAGSVRMTSLERTLIDITVRPAYAGGLRNVVDAYRAASPNVSVNRMRAILKNLGYAYPYHQAIGFLLERAGYATSRTAVFDKDAKSLNFYLMHGVESPNYDAKWKLFYPKGI